LLGQTAWTCRADWFYSGGRFIILVPGGLLLRLSEMHKYNAFYYFLNIFEISILTPYSKIVYLIIIMMMMIIIMMIITMMIITTIIIICIKITKHME
jgi:hypothetical protein